MGMFTNGFGALVLAVGAASGASFYLDNTQRTDWNQKINLEIQTPEGVKSAASVVKYGYEWTVGTNPDGSAFLDNDKLSILGEAPIIEVKPGQYLLALSLAEPKLALAAYHKVLKLDPAVRPDSIGAIRVIKNEKREVVLLPEWAPVVATFMDPDEPASLQAVTKENIDEIFGPGYSIKKVSLQITDEPVTKGDISNKLPWIANWKGPFAPKTNDVAMRDFEMKRANAGAIVRHQSCWMDDFHVRKLTFGFYDEGIQCKFER